MADSKEINNKDLLCKSGNVRVIDQACEKIDQTLLKEAELQAHDIAGIFKRTLATLSPVTQDDFAHMATDPQGACHSLDDTIAYHYSLQPEKENNFRVMLEALCEYFNLDGKSGGEVLDRKNELNIIAPRLFSKVKIDLNKITTYNFSAICKAVLSNWRNVHGADTSVTPGTLSKGEDNSIQTTNLITLCQKIESIAENPKENMGLFREVGKQLKADQALANFDKQALAVDELNNNELSRIFKSLLRELTPIHQDLYLKMKDHKSQSGHMLNADIAYHYRSKLVEQAHIRQLLSTVNFCYNHAVEDIKAKFNKQTLALIMSSSLFAKTTSQSPNEFKQDMPDLFKEIFANWPVTTTSAAGVPSSSSSIPLPGPSHPMGAAGKQVTPVKSERAIRQQGSGRLSVAELRKFFSNE